MPDRTIYWRRTDTWGLERLSLRHSDEGVAAESCVLGLDDGGYRLDHTWRLNADWRTRRVDVAQWGPRGCTRLSIERDGERWLVDGVPRPDLDGAEEPDLSVTPFCNTLPIRRAPDDIGTGRPLDTCYVDAATMTVVRSRQRYDRLGPTRFRYVDLGLHEGFVADLDVDDDGIVLRYEHLFERVEP